MCSRTLLLAAFVTAILPFVSGSPAQDRSIEATARSSYTFSRVLNGAISIRVSDGVATLAGRVRDMDQSRLAEDTVAGLEGVRRVVNRIEVDPRAPEASDEWLAVKVRSRLLLQSKVSLEHTRLDVKEGVVTVTGTTGSAGEKSALEETIRKVPGVREVRNHLEVVAGGARVASRAPAGATPPSEATGAGLPTGREVLMDIDPLAARREAEDAAITTQVRFELLTHRETSSLRPTVNTEGGYVVITGEAETEAQREAMTRLAWNVRGVVDVDNRVRVRGR